MKRKLVSSDVNPSVDALVLSHDKEVHCDAEYGVQSESARIKLCSFGFQAESPKTVRIRCDLRTCAERD